MRDLKKRILYVEDDTLSFQMVRAALADYQVIRAGTIREGLEQLNGGSFDLILLDYHLPDGLGTDLCQQILAAWPTLPIIFITSHLPEATQKQLLQNGVKAWLLKPIDFELLGAWVRLLL